MDSDLKLRIGDRLITISLPCAIIFLYLARTPVMTFGKFFHITAPLAGIFLILFPAAFLAYTIGCKKVCFDGIFIVVLCGLFFMYTLMLHPEYQNRFKDIYKDGQFSAGNVFTLWAGIYLYYLVRLFRGNEHKLYQTMKVLAWVLFFFEIWGFFRREEIYNMGFGYRMEMAAILFILQYLYENKSRIYMFLSFFCLVLALLYGSRASLLGYALFLLVYFIWNRNLTRRTVYFWGLLLGAGLLVSSKAFLTWLYYFLKGRGFVSRTLFRTVVKGNIASSPSRTEIIWPTMIRALKKLPFYKMYGAFGDRTLLSTRYPYAHNFILEILLTFGKVLGGILLLWIFFSFVMIILKDKSELGLLVVIYGCYSLCRLFFSSSFWIEQYFWALLALFVNYYESNREVIAGRLRVKERLLRLRGPKEDSAAGSAIRLGKAGGYRSPEEEKG